MLVALRIGGVEAAFVASHFLSDRLYIDGVAPDSPESIAALAKTLGIDAAKFLDDWNSAESRRRLADHWTETRRTGLTTYPTIAVRRGGRLFEVITGFATSSDIIEAVQG